jgi:hypothetical protein
MPIGKDGMGNATGHGFRYIDRPHQDGFSVACTRVNGSGRLRRHMAGERRNMIDAAVP